MSPISFIWEEAASLGKRAQEITKPTQNITKPTNPNGLILESWAQGFMVGALIIMSCITLANMRRGVLLHKLILIELIFGIWHGFFIFFESPIYNWWLSISAIFLNVSWSLHNIIAWLKNKPFLSRRISLIYVSTVILVQPYWVVEIYANFTYFHNINKIFETTRWFEALFRDPWWIFTTISLFYNIKNRYELSLSQIVRLSPRFAVMLVAMVLSICFLVVDICSVTGAFSSNLPVGINPFWKLSFVFKCLTDSVVLDDFKTALDRLHAFKFNRIGSFATDRVAESGGLPPHDFANRWPGLSKCKSTEMYTPSPDGDDLSHPKPWSNLGSDVTYVEHSKRKDVGKFELGRGPGEGRKASHLPAPRPDSNSAEDSADIAYAHALQDVSRSSQSDGGQTEDTQVGRAR